MLIPFISLFPGREYIDLIARTTYEHKTLSRFARLKPPSEVLILLNSGRKKTCFKKQVFRMWSAREDSNLRPTGPKPVALPSCATRRIGAHVTAADSERQCLFVTQALTA